MSGGRLPTKSRFLEPCSPPPLPWPPPQLAHTCWSGNWKSPVADPKPKRSQVSSITKSKLIPNLSEEGESPGGHHMRFAFLGSVSPVYFVGTGRAFEIAPMP
eukprot:5844483-Amphidinium_carterae.1